jgi:hypothetical protein
MKFQITAVAMLASGFLLVQGVNADVTGPTDLSAQGAFVIAQYPPNPFEDGMDVNPTSDGFSLVTANVAPDKATILKALNEAMDADTSNLVLAGELLEDVENNLSGATSNIAIAQKLIAAGNFYATRLDNDIRAVNDTAIPNLNQALKDIPLATAALADAANKLNDAFDAVNEDPINRSKGDAAYNASQDSAKNGNKLLQKAIDENSVAMGPLQRLADDISLADANKSSPSSPLSPKPF